MTCNRKNNCKYTGCNLISTVNGIQVQSCLAATLCLLAPQTKTRKEICFVAFPSLSFHLSQKPEKQVQVEGQRGGMKTREAGERGSTNTDKGLGEPSERG